MSYRLPDNNYRVYHTNYSDSLKKTGIIKKKTKQNKRKEEERRGK